MPASEMGRHCGKKAWPALQILQQVVDLSGNAIAAYTAEVLIILRSSFRDPFHDANTLGCACIQTVAARLGRRLQPASKELTAAVLPLTTHRRKAVRCAAIRAVRELVFVGAHEMVLEMVAWRDPNLVAIKSFYEPDPKVLCTPSLCRDQISRVHAMRVLKLWPVQVNFCGKLSTDSAHSVRAEFVDMLGAWLCKLDERIDHQGRLLPYLVSALCDLHPAVQQRALRHIEAVGELYEQDHADELKDILCYLPNTAHNVGWRDCDDAWGVAPADVLPAVFAARPRVGARRVIAANFGHIAHAVAAELNSWSDEHRLRAAKLLAVYLVFVEDWVLQHLHDIAPALCHALRSSGDGRGKEAAELCRAAAQCCTLIGLFVPSGSFCDIVLPRVQDTAADMDLRAAALQAVACNLRGGTATESAAESAPRVLALLDADGLADAQAPVCKAALANVLHACVAAVPLDWLAAHQVELLALGARVGARPHASPAACAEPQATVKAALLQAAQRLQGHRSAVRTAQDGLVDSELFRAWVAEHVASVEQLWLDGDWQAGVHTRAVAAQALQELAKP